MMAFGVPRCQGTSLQQLAHRPRLQLSRAMQGTGGGVLHRGTLAH